MNRLRGEQVEYWAWVSPRTGWHDYRDLAQIVPTPQDRCDIYITKNNTAAAADNICPALAYPSSLYQKIISVSATRHTVRRAVTKHLRDSYTATSSRHFRTLEDLSIPQNITLNRPSLPQSFENSTGACHFDESLNAICRTGKEKDLSVMRGNSKLYSLCLEKSEILREF